MLEGRYEFKIASRELMKIHSSNSDDKAFDLSLVNIQAASLYLYEQSKHQFFFAAFQTDYIS